MTDQIPVVPANQTKPEESISASGLIKQLVARNEDLEAKLAAAIKVAKEADGYRSFQDLLAMLAMGAKDPGAAANHVAVRFSWDEGILPGMPFRKVEAIFFRPGGKSPSELLQDAKFNMSRIVELSLALHKSLKVEDAEEAARVRDTLEAIVIYAGGDPDARP